MAQSYTRGEVLDVIEQGARNHGIPSDDFLRFAYAETGGRFNANAHNDSGAKGLFQIMPSTAASYGITGREMDAAVNTDAAARLYLDNQRTLTNQHSKDGHPYLSGKPTPDGLDMYVAHQQGAAGYRSIQAALATGEFERSTTRSNILNNVGDKEFSALTGQDYKTFTHMSDKDMAAAYLKYWDVKFHNARIPEKHIGPSEPSHTASAPQHAAPAQSHTQPHPSAATHAAAATPQAATAAEGKPGMSLDSGYELTKQFDNVHYKMGAKHPESGQVDCSGWVVKMQNATMDEINHKAGRPVFGTHDRFSPGFDGAAMIIEKAEKQSGVLIEGKNVTKDVLKEGMVIGEHNGSSNGKGRFHGIDHITMVVRDPKSGELMISQSSSKEGVHLTSIDSYLKYKQSHHVELYATDPLSKARNLIEDRHPTQGQAAPSASHKEAPSQPHAASSTLREGDRGPAVHALQAKLHDLGYVGADGHPLKPDSAFGPNTKAALQAYQKDHHLDQDGVAGPKTHHALQGQTHEATKTTKDAPHLNHPSNADHPLFKQTQEAVHRLDAQQGRKPDTVSDNIAGSVAVAAKKAGLSSVDHVVLSDDRERIYAVQGNLNSPFKQVADVPTAEAAQASLQQSSDAMRQVNQQLAQQAPPAARAEQQVQQDQQQAVAASR